ncbi:MAG TPA: DUF2306 domain-containing protein [Allosphingosinicella sp.]|nr:DUF2306 domain-containing protein [Allosphingosinicella sp.]
MAVTGTEKGSGWGRSVATGAVALAVTLLFLALSALIARPAGWQAPAGADIALYVHLFTVVPAVPLGAYVLWAPKGNATHKLLGRIWGGMMMVTAASSFWLQTLSGGLSFIHLFAVLTLVSIPLSVWQARRGNIRAHRNAVRGVYAGLIAAGLMAAAPGRFLGVLIFG